MKTTNRWTLALGILGLTLVFGCSGGSHSGATAETPATETTAASEPLAPGEYRIEVTDAGFVPAVVELPKGQAATLVVTRKVETCATEMIFAGTTEKHDLPLNQTVRVAIPAERADTLNYACAMDMIKGQIVSK